MKKLAAILAIAALPMLGGCVVYGTGPAGNAAWANYDHTYDYGHKGYDRPITYGNSFGFDAGYGGGFSAGEAMEYLSLLLSLFRIFRIFLSFLFF